MCRRILLRSSYSFLKHIRYKKVCTHIFFIGTYTLIHLYNMLSLCSHKYMPIYCKWYICSLQYYIGSRSIKSKDIILFSYIGTSADLILRGCETFFKNLYKYFFSQFESLCPCKKFLNIFWANANV